MAHVLLPTALAQITPFRNEVLDVKGCTLALQVMDFGYPQMADPAILKQYIFQKGFITESARQKREDKAAQSTLQVFLSPTLSDTHGLGDAP